MCICIDIEVGAQIRVSGSLQEALGVQSLALLGLKAPISMRIQQTRIRKTSAFVDLPGCSVELVRALSIPIYSPCNA